MYKILYENPDEDIFTRLLKIRGIEENISDFLDPKLNKYRIDPFLIDDMTLAIDRIDRAIKANEKIMIFGDYDVDGITSSFLLYSFFTKFLKYKNISIRLPNRLDEGYGMRTSHIDEVNSLDVKLLITVDNGITAVNEIDYANSLGIDVIVTDHHKPLDKLPKAYAIINPHTSKGYSFKSLAGVGVAFKLISAMSNSLGFDEPTKKKIINYFLPIVAIGTVADCVPLINENRSFVKLGLDILNSKKGIPPSISNLLEYLNIKNKLDTFHIGFVIAPRLNASGRLVDPYQSLQCLLFEDKEKQKDQLIKLESINLERRKMQEEGFKSAEKNIESERNIIISYSEDYHEGIIGLIAGKLTEKYNKPSVIISLNKDKGIATASLRGPDYFDVVNMLNAASDYMIRYGGHKQAGGMTLEIDNLENVIEIFHSYADQNITNKQTKKIMNIDTILYDHELDDKVLGNIYKFAPFGEGNPEPIFLIENVSMIACEKVGKNGNGHLKIHGQKNGKKFPILFWGKGGETSCFETGLSRNVIGKIRKDEFNGGFYIEGMNLI